MTRTFYVGGPTDAQLDLIEKLRRKLRISKSALDTYAEKRWGVAVADLAKIEASALLDRMTAWDQAPDEIRIISGQRPLF